MSNLYPTKEAALAAALAQLALIQPAPTGSITNNGFKCRSIEKEKPRNVWRTLHPYVGISLSGAVK